MRGVTIAFSATLFLLASLCPPSFRILGAGERRDRDQLSGCICNVDPVARQLNVVRWNGDRKLYELQDPFRLTYDDRTKVAVPAAALTVSDLSKGRSLLLKNPFTGKAEEITGVPDLVRYKAHLRWEISQEERTLREIILVPTFDGETLVPVEDPGSPTGLSFTAKCSCR